MNGLGFEKQAACKRSKVILVYLGATAESSRCRSSIRRGSIVSLGFDEVNRKHSAQRRKRRWNLAPPREKTPTPPPTTAEVEERKDDDSEKETAQGRNNMEWRRLLMTTQPEAEAEAATEDVMAGEVARRTEKRPSLGTDEG